MSTHDLIVVGASAGGVEALQRLVGALPHDLPAAVCVVLHLPGQATSVLPQILARAGPLPAAHACHGEPLRPGRIYVAPPNRHLLVQDGRLALSDAARENNHRPAIDPLFRSAARARGPRIVGVLLSGADDDGTEGLLVVKARGGVALVQEPDEALYSRMPRSALTYTVVDAVLPVRELARELARLSQTPATLLPATAVYPRSNAALGGEAVNDANGPEQSIEEVEQAIDAWHVGHSTEVASGFICPLCGGGIWQSLEGMLPRYRCHTGHVFSPESFNTSQAELLEDTLWRSVSALEQRIALYGQLASQAEARGAERTATRYRVKSEELRPGVELLRELLAHNGESSEMEDPDGC